MQYTGYIRWWDYNSESFSLVRGTTEIAAVKPMLVPFFLYLSRFKVFGK
jgi:hypothetical protein